MGYTAPVTIDEENKLVRSAQENLESFEALYHLYLPKVYGFVVPKVHSRSLAEDLVGEIFLKILDALPRYRFQGFPFGAWVFRIARNHLRDHYAKAKRQQHDTLDDTGWIKDEDEANDPAELARRASLREGLLKSFEVLTDQEAEVVRLKYFADLSNQEIAETLDLNPNHVGVILYRALKKLRNEHP